MNRTSVKDVYEKTEPCTPPMSNKKWESLIGTHSPVTIINEPNSPSEAGSSGPTTPIFSNGPAEFIKNRLGFLSQVSLFNRQRERESGDDKFDRYKISQPVLVATTHNLENTYDLEVQPPCENVNISSVTSKNLTITSKDSYSTPIHVEKLYEKNTQNLYASEVTGDEESEKSSIYIEETKSIDLDLPSGNRSSRVNVFTALDYLRDIENL